MTDKEMRIACLRAELVEYLSETTEKEFDMCRLDKILDRLEALAPVPPQTF